jgi:hypothetical protein
MDLAWGKYEYGVRVYFYRKFLEEPPENDSGSPGDGSGV